MPKTEDDLVLLIHGTFAAPEKGKLKWWEIGSNTWKEIEKRLPAGMQLAAHKEIFKWSGENQERDRCYAGNDLLNRLLKLEKQGRPYHLIGHSHGGSVIWNALQEAVRRRIGCKRSDPRLELPNLRSWATVGTPFLQFRESRMGRWPGAILTNLFFLISLCLTVVLGLVLYGVLRRLAEDWGGDSEFKVPVIIAVVVSAVAIAAIPGLALHVWTSAIRREALAVRQTAMVRNYAMLEFGNRWLGIWSREDEAISGLKSTVKLRMQLLPRLQFQTNRVFQYDRRIWSYRFLMRWLLAPVLNTTFIPYGNGMILSTVSKSAQGDDRPGCTITSVSEGPICFQERYRYPSLPADVDEALVANANKSLIAKAPELVPKVRTLLADYSSGVALLGGTIKESGFEFVGDELVHTSYFDNGHVLDLLTHHVQLHQPGSADAKPRNDGLAQWYQTTRQDVEQNVINAPSVRKRSLVHLAKKNRCAQLGAFFGLAAFLCFALMFFGSGEAVVVFFGISALSVLPAIIFGRFGQLAAERGARFRRAATIGVNLGLSWLTFVVFLPLLLVVISIVAFSLLGNGDDKLLTQEMEFAINQAKADDGQQAQADDETIRAFAWGELDSQREFYFVSDKKIFVKYKKPAESNPKAIIKFDEIEDFEIITKDSSMFERIVNRIDKLFDSDQKIGRRIVLELKDGDEYAQDRSLPLPRDKRMATHFIHAIQSGTDKHGKID